MNPYEILGVRPTASHREISDAYRILAQIFHPDRFADSPKKIQEEAERRMQALNDAYGCAMAGPAAVRDAEARARATAPTRPNARRSPAEERTLPTGQAIPKRKTDVTRPSTLLGLGLARETNKLRCRGCNSVQWLPSGWREGLASLDYHCSMCDRRILAR